MANNNEGDRGAGGAQNQPWISEILPYKEVKLERNGKNGLNYSLIFLLPFVPTINWNACFLLFNSVIKQMLFLSSNKYFERWKVALLAPLHVMPMPDMFPFSLCNKKRLAIRYEVTNTRVVQLPMLAQRSHLTHWVATLPALYHSACIHVVPSVRGLWK